MSDLNERPVPEESKKGGSEILAVQRRESNQEFERPVLGLGLSGLSAGLDLGFSLLLSAVVVQLLEGSASRPVLEVCTALAYSLGFLFVILGRSELFTEHTTLDILPVLAGDRGLRSLFRVWSIVYVSNLVGIAIFAALAGRLGPALGIFDVDVLDGLAAGVLAHPGQTTFFSAVFAGWLMGLVSWLVAASRDTIGQIAVVIVVTGSLGLCHLHHCIEGSGVVLSALFAGQNVSWGDYFQFLGWATLGNCVGGTIFVALIKHGHITAEPANQQP